MDYKISYHTDVGIVKKNNEDSLCIKVANTPKGKIVFSVICDGMGGLACGDIASEKAVNICSDWFDKNIDYLSDESFDNKKLQQDLTILVKEINETLINYGLENNVRLGTTLSAILIIEQKYYIIHVGDSRIYKITDKPIQITKDHSLVALEVERGLLSKEDAKNDKRKNILLQCIGAVLDIYPCYIEGEVSQNDVILLCTDGLIHKIKDDELVKRFNYKKLKNISTMKKQAIGLVGTVKKRFETDNITLCLIKCC